MVSFLERLGKLARAETSPDPRGETPCQAKKRLHDLERKATSVRTKIDHVYDLGEPSPSDAQIEAVAAELSEQLMSFARPQKILHENWIGKAELQKAMTESLRDYLVSFRTHRDLKVAPVREGFAHYDSSKARDSLARIYANHLTNAAEARFIAHRVDAFDAHLLNGLLIRTAIDTTHASIDKDAYLDPAQQRPANNLENHQQIDMLRNYWRNRVTDLNGALTANGHYARY